ncbi:class II fructose-bisphosphatase [Egibacter rhizosphaerae]|uniref:Fructose-1,6-bisphosphatase n=1 Tax=Egibacter rhizosphaerae TaxID=1670831 RepID=A0A411YIY6_9ACTN|nr:class II fructose-bisphosphatase [Egibacter rhizosphaerae]QBI21157.1 class II fructose-bisphosphatase [Egibacter rhizosphaerae]
MTTVHDEPQPDRELALELVRATEVAALAGGRWMGRNEKEEGDGAAVEAMRKMLATAHIDGTVIIGEGEKDEAPMLYNGERVGTGSPPAVDIAVDPVEGTRLLAEGRHGATSLIAAAPRGTMFDPGPMVYMLKWIVGPDAAGAIDVDAPVAENLRQLAQTTGKSVSDLTIVMLDRPRHAELMDAVRAAGARLRLIMDGDSPAGLLAAMPEYPYDALVGIGGTPEGVATACAVRALRGGMIGRLWARNDEERARARELGYELDEPLTLERLVASQNTFFIITGVTSGDLVEGVNYGPRGATTESLVMRGTSGTVRWIKARHTPEKLADYRADAGA